MQSSLTNKNSFDWILMVAQPPPSFAIPTRGLSTCPLQANLFPTDLNFWTSAWKLSQVSHIKVELDITIQTEAQNRNCVVHTNRDSELGSRNHSNLGNTGQEITVPAINSHLWINLFGTKNQQQIVQKLWIPEEEITEIQTFAAMVRELKTKIWNNHLSNLAFSGLKFCCIQTFPI